MVLKALIDLCLAIDKIIYGLISFVFQIFMYVSRINLYESNGDVVGDITNRIYVILGVAMLFVLAYNIVLLIMSPDKFNSKDDKSLQGLLKNLVITGLLITLAPTLFTWMGRLQNSVIDSHVLEKVILGNTYSNSQSDAKNAGSKVATIIFSTFFHPVEKVGENYVSLSYKDCVGKGTNICNTYVEAYKAAENGYLSYLTDNDILNNAVTAKNKTMEYLYVVSTVAGCIALLMFCSYTIDIGIRCFKLAFLQLIAPIPIILRITKPSGGMFSKWLNELKNTYLSLYIKLSIIYFSMFSISLLGDVIKNSSFDVFPEGTSSMVIMLTYFVIVLGILLFAKEAPKLLSDFFGGKGTIGGFGIKDIMGKIKDANSVATKIPLAGAALRGAERLTSKGYGALSGGLGAVSTALQNRKSGLSIADSFKQGAANGFIKGGRQFGSQRSKIFTDRYGYGKHQGLFGGTSLNDKIAEKYGKASANSFKENARRINEAYINNNLGDQIPTSSSGVGVLSKFNNSLNANYAAKSDDYKNAASYVDQEAVRMGETLSSSERRKRINERLANIAKTSTNENQKRSINSYLARENMNDVYNSSILSRNADVEREFKQRAADYTRNKVNEKIKTYDDAKTYLQNDTTAGSIIQKSVSARLANAKGDINSLGLSDETLSSISNSAANKLSELIKNNGGDIRNVTLTNGDITNVQATLQAKVSDEITRAGGALNINLNGGDASIRANVDSLKAQYIADAENEVDDAKIEEQSKLTEDEEKAIRAEKPSMNFKDNSKGEEEYYQFKIKEKRNSKRKELREKEIQRIAEEKAQAEYEKEYTDAIKKQLAAEKYNESVSETLRKRFVNEMASEEVIKEELQDYLVDAESAGDEAMLRKQEEAKAVDGMQEMYKKYAEGLANGDYTREVDGKVDEKFSRMYKDNETVIEKGVKTKSSEDIVFDNFKEWMENKNKK